MVRAELLRHKVKRRICVSPSRSNAFQYRFNCVAFRPYWFALSFICVLSGRPVRVICVSFISPVATDNTDYLLTIDPFAFQVSTRPQLMFNLRFVWVQILPCIHSRFICVSFLSRLSFVKTSGFVSFAYHGGENLIPIVSFASRGGT